MKIIKEIKMFQWSIKQKISKDYKIRISSNLKRCIRWISKATIFKMSTLIWIRVLQIQMKPKSEFYLLSEFIKLEIKIKNEKKPFKKIFSFYI